ncbi:MAG: hypothetical protein ACK4WF_07855 [Candidatus Brocadiales bacterium]
MKSLILAAVLLNLLIAHSSQAAPIPWEKDFEGAQKKAQDTGKLLLIDFFHPM